MPNIDDFDLLDNMPEVLPVIAITHPYVLFPYGVQHFRSSLEEKEVTPLFIADIRASGDLAVSVPTKPSTKPPYQSADLHGFSVLTHITETEETAEGTYRRLARGIERVKIGQIVQEKP